MIASPPPRSGGPRVAAFRDAALAAFTPPNARSATFRHTPLRALLEADRTPAARGAFAFDADTLGLLDGRLAVIPALPHGVTVDDLGAALDADAPPDAAPLDTVNGAFNLLHDACVDGGLRIRVAPGARAELRLDAVAAVAEGLRCPLIQVDVGQDAALTLLESWRALGDDVGLHHARIVVRVGPGASVEHVALQDQRGAHLAGYEVDVGERASYRLVSVSVGGSWARVGVDARLTGAGAQVRIATVALGAGAQHHDHTVRVRHEAPGCTSEEVGRSAVSRGARAVWSSLATVTAAARGADVRQEVRGMLLDGTSRVTNDPQLEIHTDEVKASHGATVGRLDREALFFLQSRGIPLPLARQELTGAFVRAALDGITADNAREAAEALVGRGLAAVTS